MPRRNSPRPRSSSSADPVTAYARAVTRKRKPIAAGPHVRAACARHLRDRKEGQARGLVWDAGAAGRAIRFFRVVLRLNSGEYEGRPFELLPWQRFVVGSVFGWKRGDGARRFRRVYIEAGKGCGKSPLAGGVGLLMLCADGEVRAEVYSAAYNQAQAEILFRDAVAMVEQSPELSARLQVHGEKRKTRIDYLATRSWFQPISSERQGRGKSGPKPHCALLDEIHEHPTNATVEFLDAGVKHRRQPLTFMITNSGSDRETVCWEYHDYACKIAAGALEDDSFFGYVCALDGGDDPFKDEGCWIKANPSLPGVPGYDYLRDQAQAARGIPSKRYVVRRLNFCEWTESAEGWLPPEIWFPAQAALDLAKYEGLPCYGGLDLAISSDLTALVLAFEAGHRKWDVFSFFWMPGDRLLELQDRDNMTPRHQQWRDQGHLFAPPGKVIDYEHAARLIVDACLRFDVRAIAYDRAKLELLAAELDKSGAAPPLVEHGQGFYRAQKTGLWMPGSIEETEAALIEQRLRIHENPVMNWCVASANCVPSSIEPSDRRFDKRKSSGRIDGAVALVEAIGAACHADALAPPPSVYQSRGLRVI